MLNVECSRTSSKALVADQAVQSPDFPTSPAGGDAGHGGCILTLQHWIRLRYCLPGLMLRKHTKERRSGPNPCPHLPRAANDW